MKPHAGIGNSLIRVQSYLLLTFRKHPLICLAVLFLFAVLGSPNYAPAQSELPDLAITSVDVNPGTANIGDYVYVTLKVRNIGNVDVAEFAASISISPGCIDPNNFKVTGGLKAGAEYIPAYPIRFHVPPECVTGTYSATATISIPGVQEKDTSNNQMSAPLQILSPDLALESISLDRDTANVGDYVSVTLKVRNVGGVDVAKFRGIVRISPGSSQQLFEVPGGLKAEAEYLFAPISFQVPENCYSGTYKLTGSVDIPGILERISNINNNSLTVPLHVLSPKAMDMEVKEFVPMSSVAPAGGSLYASVVWVNNGNSPPSSTPTPDFYISKAPLRSGPVFPRDYIAGYKDTVSVNKDIPPGDYYLSACIDPDTSYVDANPDNNCYSTPFKVISPENAPDLSIKSFNYDSSLSYYQGDFIKTSFEITNGGAATDHPVTISGYLEGYDGYRIDLVGNPSISGIASNTTLTRTFEFQIPYSTIPNSTLSSRYGYYALHFCLDPDNSVMEIDETDNCKYEYSFWVKGRPDFEVVSLHVNPLNPWAEESIDVSFAIRNNGNNTEWLAPLAVLIWSDDSTLDMEDPVLDIWRVSTTASHTFTTVVPFSVNPGIHYLWVCVNQSNEIEGEIDKTNNCNSASVLIEPTPPITVAPKPAQIIAEGGFTDVLHASPGDPVNLYVGLRNVGGQASPTNVTFAARYGPYIDGPTVYFHSVFIESIPAGQSKFLGPITLKMPAINGNSKWIAFGALIGSTMGGGGTVYFDSLLPVFDLKIGYAAPQIQIYPPFIYSIGLPYASSETHPWVPYHTKVSWSRNSVPSASDLEVASFDIGNIYGIDNKRIILKLPEDTPKTSYITTCFDTIDSIAEYDESNNCSTTPFTIGQSNDSSTISYISDIIPEPSWVSPDGTVLVSFYAQNNSNKKISEVTTEIVWSTDELYRHSNYSQGVRKPILAKSIIGPIGTGERREYRTRIHFPSDLLSGTYYILVCRDETYCASFPIQIRSPKSNDIRISAVSLSANKGAAGDEVRLGFTASNLGNFGTEKFGNVVRWSADPLITPEDPAILKMAWGGLNAFETVRIDPLAIRIPRNVKAGTYYIGVCANDYPDFMTKIVETNEKNNCSSAPFTVSGTGSIQQDAIKIQSIVSDIVHGSSGENVQISWRIKNNNETETGPIHFDISYSEKNEPVRLNILDSPGISGAISQTFGPVSVQIPSSAKTGPAFLSVSARLPNGYTTSEKIFFLVGESEEYDLQPYLYAPPNVEKGKPLAISVSTFNNFIAPLYLTTRTVVYWSPDPAFASYHRVMADLLVGNLAGGSQKVIPASFKLPEDAPLGTNYLTACVDSTDVVKETDETNNCQTVVVSVVATPDNSLQVADFKLSMATAAPGEFIGTSFIINASQDAVTPTGMNGYIMWSTDKNFDEQDFTINTVSLRNPAAGFYNINVQMPDDLISGTYYLGVCLWVNSVYNCASAPIQIRSEKTNELKIDNVGISTHIGFPGSKVWLSFNVVNDGNAATPTFSNSIRWARRATVAEDDPELREIECGELNPFERLPVGPLAVSIPDQMKPGSYYISVCADVPPNSRFQVAEGNKNDNCSSIPFTVIGNGTGNTGW